MMKKFFVFLGMAVLMLSVPAITNVYALELGTEITSPDLSVWLDGYDPWYGPQEDNEVESGWRGQANDLEGWFLNGSTLTMVGGWDFVGGQTDDLNGAIFFDIDGDMNYGTAANQGTGPSVEGVPELIANSFGYEFGLVLDFATNTYNLYALNENSTLLSVEYQIDEGSNAWRIVEGDLLGSYSFDYVENLSSAEVGGLQGGVNNPDIGDYSYSDVHNAVMIDLSVFLDPGQEFYVHHTMKCGNDDLIGHGYVPVTSAVPEPSTLLLLGLGLSGLFALGRKRFKK
jgi:hypothetical protein